MGHINLVDRDAGLERLKELVDEMHIAMLTTIVHGGWMRSRPMGIRNLSFDGSLWFFTQLSSPKVLEIELNPQVQVSMVNTKDNHYLSVAGTASISLDRQKMEALWNKGLESWFPDGLEDPDLALLKIEVEHAHYWDEDTGFLDLAAGFIKSQVTGKKAEMSYGTKVNFGHGI